MLKKICMFWSLATLMIAASSANADTLFYDNFNRTAGTTVGNGWIEDPTTDVSIVTGGFAAGNLFPPNTPENAMRLRGDPSSGTTLDVKASHINIVSTGFSNIGFTFDWKSLEDGSTSDKLFAGFSIDSGSTWTNLTPSLLLTDEDNWMHATYSLSPSGNNQANLGIRFATLVNDEEEGVKIDNVNVTGVIPEPEIYAMMAIGLALMGFVARRRRGLAVA